MKPDLYNYHLPPDLIAQTPAKPRDHSRLMVIDRNTGRLSHHYFYHLPQLLRPSDILVFNNTKVFPARLFGHKTTGGKVEILLLKDLGKDVWEYISRPGLKPCQKIRFSANLTGKITSPNTLKLKIVNCKLKITDLLKQIGYTPLPPYIRSHRKESVLRRQYQTVYASRIGSAAAPTAGLHFSKRLLDQLEIKKFRIEYITLHVGLGTFKSPTPGQIASGRLHPEWFTLDRHVANRLNRAKAANRRIIAVGTTTTRVLESCSGPSGKLTARRGETDIFIKPPYKFRFIDGLITNFHLPGTSLIMLVSAFSSWPIIRKAYRKAISLKYRFYSFGDTTLII
jgi:S-adenosylmethionine:tRNA ribosyltransferase-isomerase